MLPYYVFSPRLLKLMARQNFFRFVVLHQSIKRNCRSVNRLVSRLGGLGYILLCLKMVSVRNFARHYPFKKF